MLFRASARAANRLYRDWHILHDQPSVRVLPSPGGAGSGRGYNFLDCIIAPDACAAMNRCVENIDLLENLRKEKFFITYSDVPMKSDETALKHYVKQMRLRVLEPLHNVYGIDISQEALLSAVRQHNRVCSLINQAGKNSGRKRAPHYGI